MLFNETFRVSAPEKRRFFMEFLNSATATIRPVDKVNEEDSSTFTFDLLKEL